MSQSGVFDLRDIGSTSLGKLLNALPVPVLLIDQWFCVAFLNESCAKLSLNYERYKGSRFTDLLPYLHDAERAKVLNARTMTLLEQVFADRRPRKAEAILEIGKHKRWTRLNLRTIRLGSGRNIMAIIEDLTSERTYQHVSQRDEKELRKKLLELENRYREVNEKLSKTRAVLEQEIVQHKETKMQLQDYLECKEAHGYPGQ
jgi:hypothetical protein